MRVEFTKKYILLALENSDLNVLIRIVESIFNSSYTCETCTHNMHASNVIFREHRDYGR